MAGFQSYSELYPMKGNMRSIFVSITLVLSFSSFGQFTAQELYDRASIMEAQGDFEDALESYRRAKEKKNNLKAVNYKILALEFSLGQRREESLDQLQELRQSEGSKDEMYLYYLGKAYDYRYEFQKAQESFESLLNSAYSLSNTQEEIIEAASMLTRRKMEAFANPDNYEIEQLPAPINSEAAEFSPTYFEEKHELLFASSRSNAALDIFEIYHAKGDSNNWSNISKVPVLGEFERATANIEVVDEDGKLFLFNPEKEDLLYSDNVQGVWQQPIEFDTKIKTTHLESHFYINEHEDRIIFASVKNRKKSGLDLYQTYKHPETGNWTKPEPFASNINSEFDEDSPFLTHDEMTLYFSSNGHDGIGGFDVFKSEFDTTTLTWSDPVNLGFPINSPEDEVHFKINPDGRSGYFSSNRLHSMGDFDIYFYFEISKVKIEGKVFDQSTKKLLSDVEVVFTPSKYEEEKFRSVTNGKGVYGMEIISDETYRVEIKRGDDVIFTDRFEIHEVGGNYATTHVKNFIIN